MTDHIYHIASLEDWRSAQARGVYTTSTRDRSLADVGFIHASYANQVADVANAFYADASDLVLLEIDPFKLSAQLTPEAVGDKVFPHIYGPLNVDAVVEARPFAPDAAGRYSFNSA